MLIVDLLVAVIVVGLICAFASIRIVKEFERGVVFRLGRVYHPLRTPGLTFIAPMIDRLQKFNLQIITLPVPAQDGITRDNGKVAAGNGQRGGAADAELVDR